MFASDLHISDGVMQLILSLVLLGSAWSVAVLVWPGVHLADLWTSFAPYLLWGHGILALLLFVYYCYRRKKLKKSGKRTKRFKRVKRYFVVWAWLLVAVLHVVLARYWWGEVDGFYHAPLADSFIEDNTGSEQLVDGVKVLYANMYVNNEQLKEFLAVVQDYEPDVLALVEFSRDAYDVFGKWLEEKYRWINREAWEMGHDGTLFASRFGMREFVIDARPYVDVRHFVLDLPSEEVVMSVVHTSSPLLYGHFARRNIHLQSLLDNHVAAIATNERPHVLLGDFNVSPWSSYYQGFADADLGVLGYENVTRMLAPHTTWCLDDGGVVCSHIDHVFLKGGKDSGTSIIDDLAVVDIPGSDHRGYVFQFAIDD